MRHVLTPRAAGPGRWQAEVEVADAADAVLQIGPCLAPYTVRVDGQVVHEESSSFARSRVDVSHVVTEGPTTVEVVAGQLADLTAAAPRRPRARWRTRLVDDPALRWVRTPLLGLAPGIPAPQLQGPMAPLLLDAGAGPRVEELRLLPRVAGDTGIVDVQARVSGADRVLLTLDWHGEVLRVDAPVVHGIVSETLRVPTVDLWWPHTHGDQPQGTFRMEAAGHVLDLPGDGTTDTSRRRVAFRTVANADPAALDLRINGEAVFVRGAVWTPGDLDALGEAARLGFNLVRVPGIAHYESDEFHERCAEIGVMVWQDLMLATFDYPVHDRPFRDVLETELRVESERLLGRGATVVICGSAEHEQQSAMFGTPLGAGAAHELWRLTSEFLDPDLDAIRIASTPTGGVPPTRVDTGIAQYFGVGAYRRPLSDLRTAGVRFAAESLAFSNPPAGHDAAERTGVPRDNGADWDFADVREHYAQTLQLDPATVAGEVMARAFAEWRRPGSACRGAVVMWLRDLAPGAGWGLLDHRGAAKPMTQPLQPLLQSRAVWLLDEGNSGMDVHLANDGALAWQVEVEVELLRDDGHVVEWGCRSVAVPARGHVVLGVEELIDRFVDVTGAHRFGDPAHAEVVVRARSGEESREHRLSVDSCRHEHS